MLVAKKFWRLRKSGKLIKRQLKPQLDLKGHQDVVYSVAFSPDGRLIASGSADHIGKCLLTLEEHNKKFHHRESPPERINWE